MDLKPLFYDWMGANKLLFRLIYSYHSLWYDQAMSVITRIGDYHNFPMYFTFLILYAALTTLFRKLGGVGGVKQYLGAWLGVLVVIAVSFGLDVGIIHVLKNYFSYPRPFVNMGASVSLAQVELGSALHSFPSHHVAFATLMLLSLWQVLTQNLRIIGIWLVALIAWSRIALGAHFPADVLGGFLIGVVVVLIVRPIVYKLLYALFGIRC